MHEVFTRDQVEGESPNGWYSRFRYCDRLFEPKRRPNRDAEIAAIDLAQMSLRARYLVRHALRKLGTWIMSDDRRFLGAVGFAIVVLAATTWFVVTLAVTQVAPAIETASYERPTVVSTATINVAERAAQVLGDDPEVRFMVDLRCGEVDAIGCAPSVHPGVIVLDAEYVECAVWYQVRSVTFHEAAHVAEQLRGLDASAFGEIDPEVKPGEAFADCVAAALEDAETTYIRCPIEWQDGALNVLGVDRLVRVWLEGESEPTLALWR